MGSLVETQSFFVEISRNQKSISTNNDIILLGTRNEMWGNKVVSCCGEFVLPMRMREGWPAKLTLRHQVNKRNHMKCVSQNEYEYLKLRVLPLYTKDGWNYLCVYRQIELDCDWCVERKNYLLLIRTEVSTYDDS